MFDSIVEPHRPVETTMTPGQAVRSSAVISNLLRSQRLPFHDSCRPTNTLRHADNIYQTAGRLFRLCSG
jgi:hypothetical protein